MYGIPDVSGLSAEQACELVGFCKFVVPKAPHRVYYAYLKTICNAWPTSERTQQAVGNCKFCGVIHGDTVRHYVCCPTMCHIRMAHFDRDIVYGDFSELWLLGSSGATDQDRLDACFHVCLVYLSTFPS